MLIFLRVGRFVAILSFYIVAQLGGQLASSVQALGSFTVKVVIAKDLPNLGQVYHVAIVQAVVIALILIVELVGEVKNI